MQPSLRWFLPTILITFTVILSIWSYQTNGRIAVETVMRDQVQHITLELDQLQRHIELELREGMISSIQEEISTLGVDPNVEIAFLSDHNDTVIASIFFATVGNPLESLVDQYLASSREDRFIQFSRVKNTLSSSVFLEEEGGEQKVVGIYPVVIGRKAGELRPTLIGILYAQRSIKREKEIALQGVTRQISQFAALLSLLTIVLWMLLHFQVTERIRKIVHATRLVSEGRLDTRTSVSGDDEVGQVGSAIDEMVRLWSEAEERVFKLSQGVEQSTESMVIMDYQGVVEYVNPAFTHITGYEHEDVVGEMALWFRDKHDPVGRDVWETMILGNSWRGRVVEKRKNGTTYPAMLTVSPIKDESGKIVNYVAVQQDLTEHENLEEQFYQAQKLEALGTLVGGIAHEFNNALAGMTGNLYLAKKGASGLPDVVKRLETVEKLSFRSANLIKSLLSFARKGVVQKSAIPLMPFLKEVVKIYKSSLPENISLNADISLPISVYGDANLLQQAIMNLINNARDAVEGTEDPEIKIKLGAEAVDEKFMEKHPECKPGDYAVVSVKDNGYGIKQEDIAHVFEPFFTTKNVGSGTGLGLSMVYGAIKTHGGVVEVDSAVGVGTRVRIFLPVYKEEEGEHLDSEIKDVISGQDETILLVDDDENVLSAGESVLKSINYQVLTAVNGQEAVTLYEANRDKISLVIMDVVMPEMGGVEATRRLREMNPAVKVLFATGYDREDLSRSDEMGTEKIISKPFKVDEMSHLIRDTLGKPD